METIVFLLCVYALWPLYVFAMALWRAQLEGKVSMYAWIYALPIVALAIAIDVVLNYTLFALLTLDFPMEKEYTFSQRLSRLIRQDDWRAKVGSWLAVNFLDPYDPTGKHIK